MQTLIPQPASATAKPIRKTGRVLGYGLTPLAWLLFAAGLLLSIPAFFHANRIGFMLAWDVLLVALVIIDVLWLPWPEAFTVTRTFLDSPQLGEPTRIELAVLQDADTVLDVRILDDLHPALIAVPTLQRVEAFPREQALTTSIVYPAERGDFALGRVFLRYRGAFKLVERWAAALPQAHVSEARHGATGNTSATGPVVLPALVFFVGIVLGAVGGWETFKYTEVWFLGLLFAVACAAGGYFPMRRMLPALDLGDAEHAQRVRVYPAHEDSRESTQFYLLRARQIELQKRKLRLRGVGREFESLRDYQPGDELRKISWTATARRGKLTVERSQQVWMVIDAGRLSRTGFQLRRAPGTELFAETAAERERAHLLTVTQLDQATTAATMLAQVIHGSGDKFAMLSYGRTIQQLLPPGAGPAHLRLLIDLLSQTRSEPAEADHLNAIARLKTAQRRRGLIVWITELVDSAGRPELVTAASELVRRHLVVLVLLKHPELEALAASTPATRVEMFHATAAQEMLERRRATIAQLERQGVLIVETTAEEIGIQAVSKYLEVKAEGLL
jgi:uncharacterized protein (DUF58 family)